MKFLTACGRFVLSLRYLDMSSRIINNTLVKSIPKVSLSTLNLCSSVRNGAKLPDTPYTSTFKYWSINSSSFVKSILLLNKPTLFNKSFSTFCIMEACHSIGAIICTGKNFHPSEFVFFCCFSISRARLTNAFCCMSFLPSKIIFTYRLKSSLNFAPILIAPVARAIISSSKFSGSSTFIFHPLILRIS